jgi:hypothetical protein
VLSGRCSFRRIEAFVSGESRLSGVPSTCPSDNDRNSACRNPVLCLQKSGWMHWNGSDDPATYVTYSANWNAPIPCVALPAVGDTSTGGYAQESSSVHIASWVCGPGQSHLVGHAWQLGYRIRAIFERRRPRHDLHLAYLERSVREDGSDGASGGATFLRYVWRAVASDASNTTSALPCSVTTIYQSLAKYNTGTK